MRLLIFNNGIVFENSHSGSDTRALEWSRLFLAKGHWCSVVTPLNGAPRFKDLVGDKDLIVTTRFDITLTGLFFGYILRTIKTCIMVRPPLDCQVVYSSSDLMPDAVPALFLKLKNRKLKWISGIHLIAPNPFRGFKKAKLGGFNFPTLKGLYYFFYQRIIMFFMKHLATLVFVSNRLDKEYLLRRGFRDEQVLVTCGGLDGEAINVKAQALCFDACFIGRDHPQKGTDDLVAIWEAVCKKRPLARLCLLGELERIRKVFVFSSVKDNVEFLGVLEGIRKFEVMKSAKVFICPSYYESFGIVIAEAMSTGLPVVAYDLDVYHDIYPEGMLRVPIGDKNNFANAVLELLQDENKRKILSQQALEVSQRFSWEKTADEILERLSQ